jgi:hypothetical protein
MDTVWSRVEAWLSKHHRSDKWLADQLQVSKAAIGNWKQRGVPEGRYPDLARVLGESIDWVAGIAPARGTDLAHMSPMAQQLAIQFDKLKPEAQISAFAGCIAVISRAAD